MPRIARIRSRSEEHTSELQSLRHLVCRLLLEKKKKTRMSLTHALALPAVLADVLITLHDALPTSRHELEHAPWSLSPHITTNLFFKMSRSPLSFTHFPARPAIE